MKMTFDRRFPIGAEEMGGGVHFRVWAPAHRKVDVVIEPDNRAVKLDWERDEYFSGFVDGVCAGTRYRFVSGRTKSSVPIQPLDFSRKGRTAPPRSSIHVAGHGPTPGEGSGTVLSSDDRWRFPARSAVVLKAVSKGK